MKDGPIAVAAGFDVVDERDDWIVVSKAAPLIVHPTKALSAEPTLLGGVESLLAYEISNGARLSIINRLDRETSGLVVIAKNKTMAREMGRAMERRTVEKVYQAIVFGWPEWNETVVRAPLLRQGEVEVSQIWVKQMVHEAGRPSETHFVVKERRMFHGRKVSLIEVKPETGRMHQIRVHASHLGFPLVGDKIYGECESFYLRFIEEGWTPVLEDRLLLPRQALHSSGMRMPLADGDIGWSAGMAGDMVDFWSGAVRGD